MSTADETADGPGPVVVGVDGSPESAAALAFALDEAGRRGARLRVVTAVRVPEYWNTAYRHGAPPPPPDMVESIRKGARETTQHAVDEAVAAGGAGTAAVPVTVDVITGVPAEVLLEAARDASLLVLGHRSHRLVASAVLGSVGLQCVLHASGPVTIVPRVTEAGSGKIPG